jgi:uncharacterized SAM-binding protein YcdF (DUF218 family)
MQGVLLAGWMLSALVWAQGMPHVLPLPKGQTDWIVVLGAAQYHGAPSPIFKGRLEAALFLYQNGVAPRIVVTGGRQPGDAFSEGGAGCWFLRSKGVPEAALTCEQGSHNTYQNLANIKEVVGDHRILIVTDDPHLPRALILARQLGYHAAGYAVKGEFSERYYARERLLRVLAWMGVTSR